MKAEKLQPLNCAVSEADVKNADKQHADHKAGKYVARPIGVSRCVELRSHDDGSRCPKPQTLENKTQETMHAKSWKSLVKEADEGDVKVASWLSSPPRPFFRSFDGSARLRSTSDRVILPKTVRRLPSVACKT